MPIPPTQSRATPGLNRLTLLLVIAAAVALSCVSMVASSRSLARDSLFELSNLVGPTTQSLLHGGGLTACTEGMGTPANPICFHAGRMPMASMVVAMGIEIFGDHFLRVDLFKTLLFLIPIAICLFLVWQRLPSVPVRRLLTIFMVLAPFFMTAFLADVVNLQVEEGYIYSLLALAFALLLFPLPERPSIRWQRAILFALCVDGTYLAKGSMIAVAAVLAFGYLLIERQSSLRVLVFALIGLAPAGWALHQHHASGRYSIGTSIDGINLHKSNNADFLARYPPLPGTSLDSFDSGLNRGLYFPDEWSFNDYHRDAAAAFLRTHPKATLRGDLRKLWVMFFTIRKYGSTESHGVMRWVEEAGFLVFRLILWTAILGSLYTLVRRPQPHNAASLRSCALLFLAVVLATVFPYLVGFAYTRHVSILIYPSVLFCCRCLQSAPDDTSCKLEQIS